jgi:hypothetical protein
LALCSLWIGLLSAPVRGSTPVASAEAPAALPADAVNWGKERQFWAFRPPQAQPTPRVHYGRWPQRRVDYFLLARQEALGLSPAFEAGKRTLVRRVTFDLTGLPPSTREVDAFLADARGDAFERLVERLLESPKFGEHLASLWLPLARYAEDQAHQVGDDTKFFYPNAWRYRAWVIDAFNRDLPYDRFVELQLAADRLEGTNAPDLAALGFLGLGPKYYNRDKLEVQADEWEDRVDTVCRALLGLTVACARCHDHKFDPITMRDYYGLAGVFASTRMVNRRADGSAEKSDAQGTNLSAATLHVVEDSPEPKDLPVFLRGNVERKGPVAERRFLRILSTEDPKPLAGGSQGGSGRGGLAMAIASRDNPLTARVFVNRIWAQFFGRPLVASESNFGHSGQLPTHPELLDDLAVRFMEHGWSMKWLVRELVLSSAYRQDSAPRPDLAGAVAAADPSNETLAHMNRRRLSVEQWRDTVLMLAGELEAGGGRSLELEDPANRRRTVYARISRLKLADLLMQFDYPDANVHAEKRNTTTSAIQKLFVLNSPFMADRAKALASRLPPNAAAPRASDIERLYQSVFGRDPSAEEMRLGEAFLARPARSQVSRWEQYAQLLLASNELLYVD